MRYSFSPRYVLASIFMLIALNMPNAQAALDPVALTSDLDNLILQGNDLLVTIDSTALTSLTMTSQLGDIETEMGNYQSQLIVIYDLIVADSGSSLTVSDDMLVALQTLSTQSASLANASLALTAQIADLAASTTTSSLEISLTAMLRLSDDIGEMADRILEMADKILIMADNIGLMADRIIATQIIQSDNLKLVVDATLQTQTNTINLITQFL